MARSSASSALRFLLPIVVFLICISPNLWLRGGISAAETLDHYSSIFIAAWLWLSIYAAIGWLHRTIFFLIPILLTWSAEWYMRLEYGQPLGENFIVLLLETNRKELRELIWANIGYFVAALMVCPGLLIGIAVYARQHGVRWKSKLTRKWFLAISLPTMVLFVLLEWGAVGSAFFGTNARIPSTILANRLALPSWGHTLSATYPTNVFMALAEIYNNRSEIEAITKTMSENRFGVTRVPELTPDVVVLVLGESSKSNHWGLYGYSRPTTPKLHKTDGVVVLENMVTLSLSTRTAVPSIISRKPFITPTGQQQVNAESSISKLFEEAGYMTHWWSNQPITGIYDTSTAIYASQAANRLWLNPADLSQKGEARGAFDDVLLKPLEGVLRSDGKHMIIMHSMGSHFDYKDRYPEAFDVFKDHSKPTKKSESSTEYRREFLNAYDNSILYTDYVLSEIIARLKASGKTALMVYVSDHGEDVWDEGCPQVTIARKSAAAYRVPALIWMSDHLGSAKQELAERIKLRSREPVTTEYVFETIADLSGVRPKIYNGKSLASAEFHARPRVVSATDGRLVDYDAAAVRNRCVIQ